MTTANYKSQLAEAEVAELLTDVANRDADVYALREEVAELRAEAARPAADVQADLDAERRRPLADRVLEWIAKHYGELAPFQAEIIRRTYSLDPETGRPRYQSAGVWNPSGLTNDHNAGPGPERTMTPELAKWDAQRRARDAEPAPEAEPAHFNITTAGRVTCNRCAETWAPGYFHTGHQCPPGPAARRAADNAWRRSTGLAPIGEQ